MRKISLIALWEVNCEKVTQCSAWLIPRIQLGRFVGGRLLTVPLSLSCSDSPLSSPRWWSANIYSEPFGNHFLQLSDSEVIHNSANSSQAPVISTLLNFIFESDSTHNSALWNEPSEFIPITRMLLDLREHLGVGEWFIPPICIVVDYCTVHCTAEKGGLTG